MLVLDLPADLVDSAWPDVERHLTRRPGAWNWVAARGKLRRFSRDRRGLDDLVQAGDTYLQVFAGNVDLLTAMNLYRLAGHEAAGALLQQLRAQCLDRIAEDGHGPTRTGPLIDACFLLGDDEQLRVAHDAHAARRRPHHRDGTRYGLVAELADARAARDVTGCDAVVAAFDRDVAREPTSFQGAGGMNAYDWLEIALVTRSEVAGEVSPRLVEL